MQIEIPFNNWSKKRLYRYKTATSRNYRYGNIGDQFTVTIQVNEETIYVKLFEITHIERVTLAFVRDHFYQQEGCDSEDEFIAIWNEIHPRKRFDDEQKVWLHLFKEIEEAETVMYPKKEQKITL